MQTCSRERATLGKEVGWALHPEGFSLLSEAGYPREFPGGGSQQNIHQLSRCLHRVMVSTDCLHQGKGSRIITTGLMSVMVLLHLALLIF